MPILRKSKRPLNSDFSIQNMPGQFPHDSSQPQGGWKTPTNLQLEDGHKNADTLRGPSRGGGSSRRGSVAIKRPEDDTIQPSSLQNNRNHVNRVDGTSKRDERDQRGHADILRRGLKKASAVKADIQERCYSKDSPTDDRPFRDEDDWTELEEKLHHFQDQNEHQARMIAELRTFLGREVDNNRKIKESAHKMTFAMENKELFIGPQASDDQIYSQFQTLLGQIKTWSVPFAKGRPTIDIDLSSVEILAEFRKVTPGIFDIGRYLRTPKNLRLFVRGFVGLVLAETLFRTLPERSHPGSDAEDIWMDKEIAHGVALIENSLFYAGTSSPSIAGTFADRTST